MTTETKTAYKTTQTFTPTPDASEAPLAVTGNTVTPPQKKQKTLDDFLKDYKGDMATALPKHIGIDRMLRVVMTEIRRTPLLKECTPASFIGSVMQCCQAGLEPGIFGLAYLIPYKNSKLSKERGFDTYECQFILGYKGMLELVWRSGRLSSICVEPVHKNDKFTIKYGITQVCELIPALADRGEFKGVLVVFHFKDGGYQYGFMSAEKINSVRDESANYSYWVKSGRKDWNIPIWEKHYIEMAKKTALRYFGKLLPFSIELQKSIYIDEAADRGEQAGYIIDGELEKNPIETPQSKSDELASKLSA
jgi:recombination protein RecT